MIQWMDRLVGAILFLCGAVCILAVIAAIVSPPYTHSTETIDGHQYVIVRGHRSIGITHSPDCPCGKGRE